MPIEQKINELGKYYECMINNDKEFDNKMIKGIYITDVEYTRRDIIHDYVVNKIIELLDSGSARLNIEVCGVSITTLGRIDCCCWCTLIFKRTEYSKWHDSGIQFDNFLLMNIY